MEATLIKQQAFELSAFLNAPSKTFANVTEVRKASSARQVFEKVTHDYSQYFQDLTKKAHETEEGYKEKFQVFIRTPIEAKLPTKEEQELEATRQYKEMDIAMKAFQKEGENYKDTEGQVKIAVILDRNDVSFLKEYFERAAVQFPLWQSGATLEEMAKFIDSL